MSGDDWEDYDDPRDWEYQLVKVDCAKILPNGKCCDEKFHTMQMNVGDKYCPKCEEEEE